MYFVLLTSNVGRATLQPLMVEIVTSWDLWIASVRGLII